MNYWDSRRTWEWQWGRKHIQLENNNKLLWRTVEINFTLDQVNRTHLQGIFFPTAAEYTFFSVVLATPSKTNHTVHHKTSLNKCKRIYREILLNVFSIFKMQSSHLFSKMSHLKDRATKHVSRWTGRDREIYWLIPQMAVTLRVGEGQS